MGKEDRDALERGTDLGEHPDVGDEVGEQETSNFSMIVLSGAPASSAPDQHRPGSLGL